MATLHWIGKEKVINHHLDVPFRTLKHNYTFKDGKENPDERSENKIIHGDNLEALKSLLPEYEGKIDCIYIDPPYNTGNEEWRYNDNVNHPQILKWLGDTVGKEGEDLSRHDKWLCMMYPRLKLLHKLLAENGVIFISIDDHELAHLRLILNEIFGRGNFIEYFCWTKTSTPPNLANKSRKTVEYIICFEKKKSKTSYKAEISEGGDAPLLNTGNPIKKIKFKKDSVIFNVPDGKYHSKQYDRAFLHTPITIRNRRSDKDFYLSAEFKWTQSTVDTEVSIGTKFIIKSDKFSIRFLRSTKSTKAPTNLFKEKYFSSTINKKDNKIDTNEGAKKELETIFNKKIFDYPKPSSLVKFLMKLIDNKDAIVLDSFAGSGTTAHAVLNLNKEDGGNRKFILVEMEDYANDITAERVKRVIKGYGKDQKKVKGTGGDFEYLELGHPLFDKDGFINEKQFLEDIRKYVYYTETRSNTGYSANPKNNYYLGKKANTAYYLYYNIDQTTTLDLNFVQRMNIKAEQSIVYADKCSLSDNFLQKHNIIFKKIPRDITKI